MAPASKPSSGQAVESVWGQQVHDVAVVDRGVHVTGGTSGANGTPLPLDTVLAGDPTMVDLALNELIAPVDGVYRLDATLEIINGTAGNQAYANVYTSSAGVAGVYQSISASNLSAGASVRRCALAGLIVATAGSRYQVQNSAHAGGTQAITRLSWRLVAQALGAA